MLLHNASAVHFDILLCGVRNSFSHTVQLAVFLLSFLFTCSRLHFTRCSALAFLACFLSTFLLIFAVHLAAAFSRNLTSSGVLIQIFSFCFCVMRHLTGGSLNSPLKSSKIISSIIVFPPSLFLNSIVCSCVFGFHPVHFFFLFPFLSQNVLLVLRPVSWH